MLYSRSRRRRWDATEERDLRHRLTEYEKIAQESSRTSREYEKIAQESSRTSRVLSGLVVASLAASIFLIMLAASARKDAQEALSRVDYAYSQASRAAEDYEKTKESLRQTKEHLERTRQALLVRTNREQRSDPAKRQAMYSQAQRIFDELTSSPSLSPRIELLSPIAGNTKEYSEPILFGAKLWARLVDENAEKDAANRPNTYISIESLEKQKAGRIELYITTTRSLHAYILVKKDDGTIVRLFPTEPVNLRHIIPGHVVRILSLVKDDRPPRLVKMIVVLSEYALSFDKVGTSGTAGENPLRELMKSVGGQSSTTEIMELATIFAIGSGKLAPSYEPDNVATILLSPGGAGFAEIPIE